MAFSSSIINISSSSIMYQTPIQELSRRPTSISPLFSSEKLSHFSTLKASFTRPKQSGCGCSSFVAFAIATSNSSVLNEEAFKGLGGFGKDDLSEYDSEDYNDDGDDVGSVPIKVSRDELQITKLGLPQMLVETC